MIKNDFRTYWKQQISIKEDVHSNTWNWEAGKISQTSSLASQLEKL